MKARLLSIVCAAVILASAIGLSGCASTCTGDPRYDDLGCAAGALGSGRYKQQTETLRNEAQSQLANSAAALKKANTAQQQANAALGARVAAQDQVAAQQAEIDRLREELRRTQAQLILASNQPAPDPDEITRLETEVAALQHQIDILLEG